MHKAAQHHALPRPDARYLTLDVRIQRSRRRLCAHAGSAGPGSARAALSLEMLFQVSVEGVPRIVAGYRPAGTRHRREAELVTGAYTRGHLGSVDRCVLLCCPTDPLPSFVSISSQ